MRIVTFSKLIKFFSLKGPILVEHYARWSVLSWVLTYRIVCKPLRDLFPVSLLNRNFSS
jgi:hypothetical protein